jgi:hypothetical protein
MHFVRCDEYLMRKLDGFSLMEASIVLTIMGLVSVVGLGAIKRWREQQQMAITQNHQEKILTAVALYGARTGHFPYPSDPKASLDTFGLSRVPEGAPKDQVGIVPYRTLGLPEGVARDGHGRYFTYVGGSPLAMEVCATEPVFPLTVYQRTDDGALHPISSSEGDPVALILISHGANGYGAWEGAMGKLHQKLSGVHGPDERENARATQTFITGPLSYGVRTYNDDSLLWITRNHLLAMYAKVTCKPPERVFV